MLRMSLSHSQGESLLENLPSCCPSHGKFSSIDQFSESVAISYLLITFVVLCIPNIRKKKNIINTYFLFLEESSGTNFLFLIFKFLYLNPVIINIFEIGF